MCESEAKMAKAAYGECAPEVPRESVEMKLNCIGDRVTTATMLIKDSLEILFGVNPNEEKTLPTGSSGLYGLIGAVDYDSLRLLHVAEELRKRCGG